jgi:hypothetical protein
MQLQSLLIRSEKMKAVLRVSLLAIALTSAAACSTVGSARQDACEASNEKVLPDAQNPDRIRFEVCGDPFPPSRLSPEEQKLAMSRQLAIGARRYAEKRLLELGYCPYGFDGPSHVFSSGPYRGRTMFFVDCLSKK